MRPRYVAVFALALTACDGQSTPPVSGGQPDAGSNPSVPGAYKRCAADNRVGAITAALRDGFTSVQGAITNGVRPIDVLDVQMSAAGCELLRPKTLFCNPGCTGSTTCDDSGMCVPLPENQSVGTVTVTGLAAAVEMTARAPVNFYNFTGNIPHPGFVAGAEIGLTATGDAIGGFSLATKGVGALQATTATVALERDRAALVEWATNPSDPAVRVELELNIANHGGTPGKVDCTVDDTGRFEVPAALVTALLDSGFSGFPSLTVARAGVSSTDTDLGCVELRVESQQILPVSIPGLTSCSDNTDCQPPQTCQADLRCG